MEDDLRSELEFTLESSEGDAESSSADLDDGSADELSLGMSFEKIDPLESEPHEVIESKDTVLAYRGINLFFNNSFNAAENLFKDHYKEGPQVTNGYCFIRTFKALIKLEPSLVAETKKLLTFTDHYYKHLRKSNNVAKHIKLHAAIAHADLFIYKALLLLTQFEFKSSITASLLLRKAAGLFKSTLKSLENQKVMNALPEAEVDNIRGAAMVGDGIFHLLISMLPPHYLQLVKLLGFKADRVKGLCNLQHWRLHTEFHAPFANFSLLWFFLIAKPFLSIESEELSLGYHAASEIIKDSLDRYSESWFLLFYQGKLHYLFENNKRSASYFELASECSPEFPELQVFSLFELGWCALIDADFAVAADRFLSINNKSYWSRGFYNYLTGVCVGATESGSKQCLDILTELSNLKPPANNQVERYTHERSCFVVNLAMLSTDVFQLLAFELAYLWSNLNVCPKSSLQCLIDLTNSTNLPQAMNSVCFLLRAAVLNIRGESSTLLRMISPKNFVENHVTKPNASGDWSKMISAFIYYEIALCQANCNEPSDKIKSNIKKACAYRNYPFDNRLQVKVHCLIVSKGL